MTEIVAQESGTALGDIEVVAWYLKKVPETHDLLKCCHQLCYGDYGSKVARKENLSKFNGLPSADGEKVKGILSESPWNVACLKELCKFLDLDVRGKGKDDIITSAVSFLLKPVATGMTTVQKLEDSKKPKPAPRAKAAKKASAKRKSSSPAKKKKKSKKAKKEKKEKKKDKPASPKQKKARAPIVFYALHQKVSLKEKNPDLDKRALSRLVMEGWNALTAEERAPWEKKSEDERKSIEQESALLDVL